MKVKLIDITENIFAGGDVPKDRFSEVVTDKYRIPVYANAEKDNGLYGYTDTARVSVPCVTVAARGTIGFVVKRIEPFLPVVRLITVIPNEEKITLDYLYYALRNCKPKTNGTSIPQLTVPDIKNYTFEIVPIPRQEEITHILDMVELLIKMQKEQIEEYNLLIKSRFVEIFGDENNSKKWNIVNVENVADVQVGVVIKPAQYYTDERIGIKAFRSLNIGDGYIKDSDWVYFTREGHEKNSKSILKENDLLIVRSGSPGTACVVTEKYVGCNAIDIIIAHPNCDMVNPYYLCTYTNMPHGKRQIEEGTGGAAQQHFNVGKYNKLQLMLPPMELQNEFVEFMKQTDKLKVTVQKSLDETQKLFDSLMQQYFG